MRSIDIERGCPDVFLEHAATCKALLAFFATLVRFGALHIVTFFKLRLSLLGFFGIVILCCSVHMSSESCYGPAGRGRSRSTSSGKVV